MGNKKTMREDGGDMVKSTKVVGSRNDEVRCEREVSVGNNGGRLGSGSSTKWTGLTGVVLPEAEKKTNGGGVGKQQKNIFWTFFR